MRLWLGVAGCNSPINITHLEIILLCLISSSSSFIFLTNLYLFELLNYVDSVISSQWHWTLRVYNLMFSFMIEL